MNLTTQLLFGAVLGFAFVRLMRRRARRADYRRQIGVRLEELTG
jgi:hypothetical protein